MSDSFVAFMPHPPIVIPEIGEGKECKANATIKGMHKLGQLIGEIKPDTIIFTTPHGNSFSNGTCILYEQELNGDFATFGHPNITFNKTVNLALANEIYEEVENIDYISVLMNSELANRYGVDTDLDHGVMVPMYFIDKYYKDYNIVHITPGNTSLIENYQIGKCIKKIIEEKEETILLICSGDLSHALTDDGPYNYHPSGALFDRKIRQAIIEKDALSLLTMDNKIIEDAAQCGIRSFLIGFGLMDEVGYYSEIYSYEGPFGVGYLTGYLRKNDDEKRESIIKKLEHLLVEKYEQKKAQEDDYIKLARKSIENYIKNNTKLDFNKIRSEFSIEFIKEVVHKKAGVFVSIHKDGELRGCIGTISPTQDTIIDEIIYNSINACSYDPRFNKVEAKELLDLDVKVDILEEPEIITSKEELDVIKYGVIVEQDNKRGLLLPNLDGVDTVEQQIKIAMDKAGISNEERMKLFRFEVKRHERGMRDETISESEDI